MTRPTFVIGCLAAALVACGSSAPSPIEPPAPSAVASTSAAPIASALPPRLLPDDVTAPLLVAPSTARCVVRGRLSQATHELRSPGGKRLARVVGRPESRVLVLPDARQFVELTDNGVLVRGYLEESVLRLARPKTIGGVWTRRGDSVRVKSINGETVRAVLEAPAPNVEVVGAPETIDLACADLHVGREPFSLPSPGASKRTAFVRPKTTLEMSESEQSAITIRFHVADPGFAIDVLEERAGRARITFDAQTIGRFTGWVAARSLAKVPKADSSSKAEQIRRELEKLNPPSIAAVVAAPPGSSLATADRGRASIATCDLRLLADVDGTLTVIGSVAHGTPLRIGGAETTLLQVSFDGVDIDGGSSVPARDDVACKAATTPFRLFEAPRTPTLAPATVAAKNAWDIGQIDPAEGRRRLLDVVKRGAATPDEVAVLGSLCTSLRDEACIATCKEHGWPQ